VAGAGFAAALFAGVMGVCGGCLVVALATDTDFSACAFVGLVLDSGRLDTFAIMSATGTEGAAAIFSVTFSPPLPGIEVDVMLSVSPFASA